MITHLLDSMANNGQFSIISMHHEQGAAFAAEGVARQTSGKKIAVAMATSGPGATNLITGIGSCWFDSIPCLFITGQVNNNELKKARAIRQQGFQELDIVEIVRPVVKYAIQINDVAQLLPELHRAMSLAQSGRKGPVLVDIPNDIQRMEIPDEAAELWMNKPLDIEPPSSINRDDLQALAQMCEDAKRPLVCLGGGARWAESMQIWINQLENLGIPYVSTLMGHEKTRGGKHYFNMIGSYGNREANWAIQNCDLLIVIGARLDVRQTGADADDFARHAKIVQVDIDPAQLNNRIRAELSICSGAEEFFKSFAITPLTFPAIEQSWLTQLAHSKQAAAQDEYPDWEISPSEIFKQLGSAMANRLVDYVCDVGNHQMWAAQNIRLGENQSVHYSGGMGAMGFALPAAMGAALVSNHKAIVITGDGSIQINIQELDTLKRMQLDVTIIVMNNHSLGMVKNFQDMYFDGRNQSTRKGYSCPSFVELAKAYGIDSQYVSSNSELRDAIHRIGTTSSPFLIEIEMPYATECRPRLAFGKKLDEQYPFTS
ncbi:MAG: acetolactate synthase [Gallionellales bacterium RBG_16_57_15]|nr:MAG: acetolactate synthase [Gallionellales bacterium RBG_16_57_15]